MPTGARSAAGSTAPASAGPRGAAPCRPRHEPCAAPHGALGSAFVGLVGMTLHLTGTRAPFTLRFEQRAELAARCARAVRRARREGGEVLVGLTVEVAPAVDPSAIVFASRSTGENWF